MSIKLRIIILSLVGNFAIAAIFLVLAEYQSSQKDQAAIESSSNVYGQAWRTVLNDSFNNSVGFYHPQSGDPEKITIWADNPAGQEAGLSSFFAESRDVQDLRDFIDIYFEEAFAWGELSFVMAFDREGLPLHCATAYEDLGVDPCAEEATADFVSKSTGRLSKGPNDDFNLGASRAISAISDSTGAATAAFYQTLLVDVKADQKLLGHVLLGKNIADALEIFEYEFLVKALVGTADQTIELNDYYPAEDYAELGETESLVKEVASFVRSNESELIQTGFWGQLNKDLGVSYVSIPLSDYNKIEDARFTIISNQKDSIAAIVEADNYAFAVLSIVYLLIVSAIIILTTYSFGGISKAIEVLRALTEGDLTVEMPKRFFQSSKDEVGQLTQSLETYRGHLSEMEAIRSQQTEKRKHRDSVILDKMSSLSRQLQGDAKRLLEDDISRMKMLAETEDFEKAEEASAEMMGIAISRMSDEVVALIEARTGEIKTALDRNEELLLNILPKDIAVRKLADEKVIADSHESCSVLFGDIVGFTELSKDLGPERLVEFLDDVFTRFDDFSDELGLEKIKTIGDNYMVACGVPNHDPDHPFKIAEMGQKMVRHIRDLKPIKGHVPAMRIGIHSGPLVAGVIGKRKFIYDLWGDAVNTAARMESHGVPNMIHLTKDTADLIKSRYDLTSRGPIEVKGKGVMETFLMSV